MTKTNLNDLATCRDWISLARAIRSLVDAPERHGMATTSDAVRAIGDALSRTPTSVWNLLGALEARELFLADFDDAAALDISQTKLTSARVLLRKHPDRRDAIRTALRDPSVTTRMLAAAVEERTDTRGAAAAADLDSRVFASLAAAPAILGLGNSVQIRPGVRHSLVQPDFVVEDAGRVVAGIDIKNIRAARLKDKVVLGEMMLISHVCDAAVLIMPSECEDALTRLSTCAHEHGLERLRFALFDVLTNRLIFL